LESLFNWIKSKALQSYKHKGHKKENIKTKTGLYKAFYEQIYCEEKCQKFYSY